MKFVKKDINYYNRKVKKVPFILLLGVEIVSAALSLLYGEAEKLQELPESVVYVIYVVAACSLFLLTWRMILIFKDPEWKQKLKEFIHRWNFLGRMADDFTYRTIAVSYLSFGINMLFAVSKGIVGWFSTSFWLITLAVYYLILSLSKLILLITNFRIRKINEKRVREIREWKAYRFCGILFMMLTIVLQGMVVLIMKAGGEFSYHEILLLVVAMVDFYCLISSIIYMVRNRGVHTPMIIAIKNISFASSMVSMLSLQTAMFASYGKKMNLEQKNIMNLLTGSAVCILLLVFGLLMVLKANKNMKKCRECGE